MYKYLPVLTVHSLTYTYTCTCEYISSKMTIMYSLLFLSEMKPRRYDVELFFTIGENNVASLTYV